MPKGGKCDPEIVTFIYPSLYVDEIDLCRSATVDEAVYIDLSRCTFVNRPVYIDLSRWTCVVMLL